MNRYKLAWVFAVSITIACNTATEKTAITDSAGTAAKGSYAYDAAFLKQHTSQVLELSSTDGNSKILLSADYQGRVMTSTATGDTGTSFGWLNYDLIAAPEKKKQFNPVGGEERFWMGPEGGQYSIYFKGGDSFNIAHWQVPSFIDTEMYTVVKSDNSSATFSKTASITNYSGTRFDIAIERTVRLLSKDQLAATLQTTIPAGVQFVGFETNNAITNTGTADWTKEKGLLSVWLLGMFTPTPATTVIIPFYPIPNARSFITDNYFGTIPTERLQVKDSILYFTCDGKLRSKIGLSPFIAKPIAGSFDFQKNVLTIILPQVNKNADYVNSKWEMQQNPYKGDVINSYNDGPLADGTQMGPFYEVESSSPALALQKGATGTYKQTTCHFMGNYDVLKQLAKQLLGVDLDTIKK
ncbi:DUF6786 family protein [Limnovirga soli]|uniref:Uncharacterized protein n=1 Tax=Limnovirga soli TaxID=2656915 RepID=A0A8J8JRV7_9BACT|nr:DUF6786 family protein [Limnovirga soli]NNV54048.1 hypothetical protein [Limnovirga soli]